VSSAVFASVQDSPSNQLQRQLIVIKVALFEHPLPIKAQEVWLSGSRSLDASRKRAAQRTLLVREQRSFR